MIELLPRPFYHFEWWFEILKIYHGLLSCAMVSSHLYSGKEKKPQCLLMVSNSNLPELKKKKKNNRKRTFFYFLFSPLYSLFYIVSMLFCKTDAGCDKSAWHGKLFKRAALNHSSSSCEWQLSDAHSLTVMPLG